jgi:hypothetical protein
MKVYLNLQTAVLNLHYITFSSFHLLNSPVSLLKTFLSKTASRLAVSLLSVQDSAPYVAIGLVNVFYIFIFSALSTD